MRKLLTTAVLGASVLVAAAACDDATGPDSTTYVSAMTGARERPTPNTSTATGTATYVLTGNSLAYTITVNGLTAPVTGAHIHVGGPEVAGPIIFPFAPAAVQSGIIATGTIDMTQPIVAGSSSITGDSLRVLLNNGNAYTNVHTSTFPGGEIRGQIVRL